jgi:FKBP-type peptidyl-prolyl cis-trans isomerase
MSIISKIGILLFVVSSIFMGCNDEKPIYKKNIDKKKVDEVFVKINKAYIKVEDQQIDDYLNRRNWNFTRTESGVRYLVYQKGVGKEIHSGDAVTIEYTISLIRGEEIYSSKNLGDKTFKVDESEEPSGLHQVVKLLKVGDRAKVVIPSYLAYGLLGDNNKIPAKATLFYDIYIKKVR